MTSISCPKMVVLGLDGLSLSQARFVSKKFDLQNLASLVDSPNCQGIRAEIPALSPVNWTSLYTASSPREHGIFGFTELNPHTYEVNIVNFSLVKKVWIFEELSRRGIMSKIINLPNTYPAHPLKGILISGFVSPRLEGSVYPPPFIHILKEINYLVEADTTRGARDPQYLFQELYKSLDSRKRALQILWKDLAWDLFILVLTETDRLNHFFYHAIFDDTHPCHTLCKDFFSAWDNLIGELLDRFYVLPSPKRLMVVADHGFCPLIQEVDINAYLLTHGLLRLKGSPRHELDGSIIKDTSLAFSLDGGRIYIHDSRFSRGRVKSFEKKIIIRQIMDDLERLSFKNRKVFSHVIEGREFYGDSELKNMPDIICIPARGFDPKAKFDKKEIFGAYGRSGCHSEDDVFYYDDQAFPAVTPKDVGREILKYFTNALIG